MAYLWLRAARSFGERLVIAIAFLTFASLVISARLVLGAHWPSDILAGIIIDLVLLMTVILAYNRAETALSR
ncbi:MAG TPA: phosphatase PAP2 family protein [Trichocoleus sp.]